MKYWPFAVAIAILVLLVSATIYIILSEKEDEDVYHETTLEIELTVSLVNQGQAPALDIPLRLALPVEQSNVQYVEAVSYSQKPDRTTNDSWGNEFIHYTLDHLEPGTRTNFTFNLTIRLYSVDYNIQKGHIGEYNEDMDRYLLESPLVNFKDPVVQQIARDIARDSKDIQDIAWNTYNWIIENVYYQQIPGEWDAAQTLKNGEGGSAEFGNLFVALMRANGIPARRISGWGSSFDEGETLQLSRFAHGWGEFFLPNYGWVPVDPTWGISHKYDQFSKTDGSHVIMTRGAGIHFFWRGPYLEPYGETEVTSDYQILIKSVSEQNLSLKRDLIRGGIFIGPALLAIFVVVKKVRQRRI